jgi:excisionase family DNA binding protein
MTNDGDLLQLIEVARLARVSVSSVRFWIKSGRLASIRPGKRRLVRRAEFERFLERQDVHPSRITA